jgi:hypothetical protein
LQGGERRTGGHHREPHRHRRRHRACVRSAARRRAAEGTLRARPRRIHDAHPDAPRQAWFAAKAKNWDLAAYEIDEIKEGLEDAAKQFPTHDGVPVADMIKTNIDPAIEELEKAVEAKSSPKFAAAFDKLTSACNTCHAGAKKEFIRIQRPTAPPVTNQNFAPGK